MIEKEKRKHSQRWSERANWCESRSKIIISHVAMIFSDRLFTSICSMIFIFIYRAAFRIHTLYLCVFIFCIKLKTLSREKYFFKKRHSIQYCTSSGLSKAIQCDKNNDFLTLHKTMIFLKSFEMENMMRFLFKRTHTHTNKRKNANNFIVSEIECAK